MTPKFGCLVTSLCQGLRRSAGSGGEDPESQVVNLPVYLLNSKDFRKTCMYVEKFFFDKPTFTEHARYKNKRKQKYFIANLSNDSTK